MGVVSLPVLAVGVVAEGHEEERKTVCVETVQWFSGVGWAENRSSDQQRCQTFFVWAGGREEHRSKPLLGNKRMKMGTSQKQSRVIS